MFKLDVLERDDCTGEAEKCIRRASRLLEVYDLIMAKTALFQKKYIIKTIHGNKNCTFKVDFIHNKINFFVSLCLGFIFALFKKII